MASASNRLVYATRAWDDILGTKHFATMMTHYPYLPPIICDGTRGVHMDIPDLIPLITNLLQLCFSFQNECLKCCPVYPKFGSSKFRVSDLLKYKFGLFTGYLFRLVISYTGLVISLGYALKF